MGWVILVFALVAGSFPAWGHAASAAEQRFDNVVRPLLAAHCYDCHGEDVQKAGLRFDTLTLDLAQRPNFDTWVKVHDKLRHGEMPPKDEPRPDTSQAKTMVSFLAQELATIDRERQRTEGRVAWRRLNRFEYENTLRDLLSLPHLEVKDILPEDGEAHGFNKVSTALDVSHVQMASYLEAATTALNAAVTRQLEKPVSQTTRYYARDQAGLGGRLATTAVSGQIVNRGVVALVGLEPDPDTSKRRGNAARRDRPAGQAIGLLRSSYRPFGPAFSNFQASADGLYRLRVSAYGFSWDKGRVSSGQRLETLTLHAGGGRESRKLGSFDVRPDEPHVIELEAWLQRGDTIRPDASLLLRGAANRGGNNLPETYTGPGLALQWLEVEGPFDAPMPSAGHRVLFGNLPLRPNDRVAAPLDETNGKPALVGVCEVVSTQPLADAERLLRNFMVKAYRRPVGVNEVPRYLAIVQQQLTAGKSFTDAMLAGYASVLCSPGFLYLSEAPGLLDDYALASRLSYFLSNSAPDKPLLELAAGGGLRDPKILRAQTERLLGDPKSQQRFIGAFLDYWLELREITVTTPDTELYPEYTLDDFLVESMRDESRAFFAELLRHDLSVTNIVHSDFAMLNGRLARHYGIPGVEGAALRRVALSPGSHRGGFITQASVLKVTANGTTTSPVLRGAWIMERILGETPSPPPSGVPGLEPDTRGAVTIREQLAAHRNIASCATCHAKIDPPGFALESFDVMGAWRDRYRTLGEIGEPVAGVGHTGKAFAFRLAAPVDASGLTSDGHTFNNIDDFKRLLLADPDLLARNIAHQLIIYATGAGIQFSDRATIEAILDRTRANGFGLRTLVHEIVQSDIFRNK